MYEPGETSAARAGTVAPLAWASVAVCLVFVVAMAFYPFTPSNVLPLVK
jgi:hypothetical protein